MKKIDPAGRAWETFPALYSKRPDVAAPRRATPHSAGLDLSLPLAVTLRPGESTIVDMGVVLIPPHGCYTQLVSRSGHARRGLLTLGGIIDPDYTGSIHAVLHNLSSTPLELKEKEAPIQAIFVRFAPPEGMRVIKKKRGEGRFGSSDENDGPSDTASDPGEGKFNSSDENDGPSDTASDPGARGEGKSDENDPGKCACCGPDEPPRMRFFAWV